MSKLYVDEIRPKTSGKHVIMPEKPSFFAYRDDDGWVSLGGTSTVTQVWNATEFNIGNHYDTSTGRFTAPVDGVYQFYAHGYFDGTARKRVYLYHNNGSTTNTRVFVTDNGGGAGQTVQFSRSVKMQAGDYCYVGFRIDTSDSTDVYYSNIHSYFEGHLIG